MTQDIKYPNISQNLKTMMTKDQEMIRKINFDDPDQSMLDKLNKIKESNVKELKNIIKEIGWPTISKVGENASQAAWIIAQHHDKDLAFQEKCLKLMRKNKDDVRKTDLAYLTDRVLKNKGKPQLYGTQMKKNQDNNIEPYPIEDRENVDKRRKKVGLGTLNDYIERIKKHNE